MRGTRGEAKYSAQQCRCEEVVDTQRVEGRWGGWTPAVAGTVGRTLPRHLFMTTTKSVNVRPCGARFSNS